MAKNKKAQILAAVMCAATVAGVSPAISSAAHYTDRDSKATIETDSTGLCVSFEDGSKVAFRNDTAGTAGFNVWADETINGDLTITGPNHDLTIEEGTLTVGKDAFKVWSDGGVSMANHQFKVSKEGNLDIGDSKFTVQAATGNLTTEGNVTAQGGMTADRLSVGKNLVTGEAAFTVNDEGFVRTEYGGSIGGVTLNGGRVVATTGISAADGQFNVDGGTGAVSATNVTTTTGADLNAINDTLTGYKNAGLIAGTNNGEYNTVMGYDSWSNGDYNTVIGNQANIDGSFGVALGAHATVVGNNSVAIGYNSQALRDDVVSVGSFGQERQITNVAAGTENTDAVNYGQLKEVKTDLGGVSANVAGITRTGSDEEGYTTDIEGTIQVNNDGTFRAGNDKNYIGMSDAALNARFNGNGLSIGFDGTSVFGGKTRVDYNDNGATFYYGTSDEQLEYGTTNIKGGNITTNNIVVGQGADAVKIGNGDVELADGTKLSDIANKVDSIDTDISGIEDKVAGIERDEATGTTTIEDNTTISKDGITYKGENGLSTTIDGNGIAVGDKTFIKDGEISTDNINVGSINGKDVSDLASNADVAGLKDRVGTVETDVKGIKEDIGDVNAIDGEIKGDNIVSSINNEVNTRRSEISRIDNDIKHLDNRVGSLEDRMGDVEDRIDKVGAMAAAIANLRTMGYDPEAPTEIAVGVGQYESETGLALGVFHYPNQDFMLSASISTSGDEVMGGIGATWKIGRKSSAEKARSVEEKRVAKAEEMQEMAKAEKVKAQRERHAQMLAEREAAK